ncbi:MAG TPA: hypothetical protein VGP72_26985 [Planctomycetota bacterium]|jgi:hypothetical protein
MGKSLSERCPFRAGTASHKIYAVLAGTRKSLPMKEISQRSKVGEPKTKTLIREYLSRWHNAPLRRAGIALRAKNGAFWLEACAADPKATRPPRGKKKHVKKPAQKRMHPKKNAEGTVAPVGEALNVLPAAVSDSQT